MISRSESAGSSAAGLSLFTLEVLDSCTAVLLVDITNHESDNHKATTPVSCGCINVNKSLVDLRGQRGTQLYHQVMNISEQKCWTLKDGCFLYIYIYLWTMSTRVYYWYSSGIKHHVRESANASLWLYHVNLEKNLSHPLADQKILKVNFFIDVFRWYSFLFKLLF